MTLHTFNTDGSPYYLNDDPLILPDGATEADRLQAWQAKGKAHAFWLLYPELLAGSNRPAL